MTPTRTTTTRTATVRATTSPSAPGRPAPAWPAPARPAPGLDIRAGRIARLSDVMATDATRAALAEHGTPLLLVEPDRIVAQYRLMRDALPYVRWHYAVKALAHPAVIDVLARAGCGFDVATGEELALVLGRGVSVDDVIHTHPVKKPAEIRAAAAAGVTTFVVDSPGELAKFDGVAGVRLLVRLAYRSPHAKSDLSTKFGVEAREAETLVREGLRRGIRIAGFSFHVGSQLDDPERFADATRETIALFDHLNAALGAGLDVIDIGGGFPVAYDTAVQPFDAFADALHPLLASRAGEIELLAEPGRVLVADAATLVTSVVGVADRADGRWCHLDDGVYGSYSNVVAEDVHPLVVGEPELYGRHPALRPTTLAGPTCDSADVIARQIPMPELAPGDQVVSPTMGAYTAVTATRFNGRVPTPLVVLPQTVP